MLGRDALFDGRSRASWLGGRGGRRSNDFRCDWGLIPGHGERTAARAVRAAAERRADGVAGHGLTLTVHPEAQRTSPRGAHDSRSVLEIRPGEA